jgi:hypothetical protein
MDYREQKALLRKYWAAESTLEEERQLKAFFRDAPRDMDPELAAAAPLFRLLDLEAEKKCPHGTVGTSTVPGGSARIRRLGRYWEYAAVAAVVIGSLWIALSGSLTRPPAVSRVEVIRDPQEAWQTTRAALEQIAANLNKGKQQMGKLSVFHQAQQAVAGSR